MASSLETSIRVWWEDKFRQPSRGNPLWEGVPLVDHVRCFVEHQVMSGKDIWYDDGVLQVVDSKHFEEAEGERFAGAIKTGDDFLDDLERLTAAGVKDPFRLLGSK